MQNLVSAITSDFMHRFTQYVTQSFISPKRWMSSKMSDLDLPLTYFLAPPAERQRSFSNADSSVVVVVRRRRRQLFT